MIPVQTTTVLDTNINQQQSQAFTLTNNANIIELLSSKMYTKPYYAVVRELVTNALDAHLNAGLEQLPITVDLKIGTEFTPTVLTVEDYGLGISPADFNNVFLNIGVSSKADSNQQHGGFGIGALSIFSVSDQAKFVTTHAGITYTYLLYRDSNNQNFPTANCIEQCAASADQSGTKVSIPIVHSYSANKELAQAILELTAFITPRPVLVSPLTNIKQQYENYLEFISGKHAQLATATALFITADLGRLIEGQRTELLIQVGEIVYQTNLKQRCEIWGRDSNIPDLFIRWGEDIFYRDLDDGRAYLIVRVPIGVLTLAANREEISQTEANFSYLSTAITQAYADICQAYAQNLSSVVSGDGKSLTTLEQIKYAKAFGCRHLQVKSSNNQLVQVRLAVYQQQREYKANLNFRHGYARSSSDSLRTTQLNFENICKVEDRGAVLIYYCGDPLKMRANVDVVCSADLRIVRCFRTTAELDAALLEPELALFDSLVVVKEDPAKVLAAKKAQATPKTVITYANWKAAPKTVNLIKFYSYSDEPVPRINSVWADLPQQDCYLYLNEAEFKPDGRSLYAALSTYLPPDTNIYLLDKAELKLINKRPANLDEWVHADELFDRILTANLAKILPIFSQLKLYQCHSCGGTTRWQADVGWLVSLAVQNQTAVRKLYQHPLAAELLGQSATAELQTLAEGLVLTTLALLIYKETETKFPQLYALASKIDWQKIDWDCRWDKTLAHYLQPLFKYLPLIKGHQILHNNYPINIPVVDSITESLAIVQLLQQYHP
jgi:Histidine kinase-, DNA gyrase B-, and HSP90-like ATPase